MVDERIVNDLHFYRNKQKYRHRRHLLNRILKLSISIHTLSAILLRIISSWSHLAGNVTHSSSLILKVDTLTVKFKNIVIGIASAQILAACTIPGSVLKVNDKHVVQQADANVSIDELVDVYPITPLLIQRLQKPAVVSSDNQRLMQSMRQYQYRVQAGDVLSVVVWDHPELMVNTAGGTATATKESPRGGVVVNADGTIFYPYVGNVPVSGKTANEIRNVLAARLSKFINKPQLDVAVVQYRSQRAYISGAVKASAQLPITNVPLTLLDAVNSVGGYNENADIQRIKVTRNGQDLSISLYDLMQNGDLQQNFILKDGDVVYIPTNEQMKVHIMGEVTKQTTLRMDPGGMNLTEALGEASGINNNIANAKGIFVIRAEAGMSNNKVGKIYQLDLSDASAHVLGTQFQLQPNDVVYVTAAPVARWNRVMSNIFPSVSNLLSITNTAGQF